MHEPLILLLLFILRLRLFDRRCSLAFYLLRVLNVVGSLLTADYLLSTLLRMPGNFKSWGRTLLRRGGRVHRLRDLPVCRILFWVVVLLLLLLQMLLGLHLLIKQLLLHVVLLHLLLIQSSLIVFIVVWVFPVSATLHC